ncbi:dual specificity protein phosphatase 3 isoform X2 [Eurytemora carolleeae]|uniref:dual specificity protein phosphatase 3 isoform X2 n=1 Tax=Eurytemora carolleeae TaxID=1294199 RepID=UPI000C777E85|nr:dual specificity protein phosphatase 3 isoform X2 [Eurytemora carolleeae]|eukprot:XP_023328603.1 dual specificity protein phosphatase 3-like isoform X2 [Eurytemora affinis]
MDSLGTSSDIAVAGTVRFKRHFDKKHYPLLGEEEQSKPVLNTRSCRSALGPILSVPVPIAIDWLRNSKGRWHYPVNGADLVYPGVYLGDAPTALCTRILKEMGVTAVVNCGQGELTEWNYVNTGPAYYKMVNMDFLGLPAVDLPSYDISQHFNVAADFIQKIVGSEGKVLVHCVQGISRSATIVLAYMMMKKNLTIKESIDQVKSIRSIAPNEGFMMQLIMLNDQIHKL